ncbi:unnamed protein product [Calypogeia fissa]
MQTDRRLPKSSAARRFWRRSMRITATFLRRPPSVCPAGHRALYKNSRDSRQKQKLKRLGLARDVQTGTRDRSDRQTLISIHAHSLSSSRDAYFAGRIESAILPWRFGGLLRDFHNCQVVW